MNIQTLHKLKKNILNIADHYLEDSYLLFIFGSFAKENIDNQSDIDLAIYADKSIPSSIIVQIKEEIENTVGTLRTVDIINLTDPQISSELVSNILKEGKIWKEPKNTEELLRNLKKHLASSER